MNKGLEVLVKYPLQAQTPIELVGNTPIGSVYIRNHFNQPVLDPSEYRLIVDGAVASKLRLSLDDIKDMQSITLDVTMECIGNQRSGMPKPAPGAQWGLGAMSSVIVTGVPLRNVLDLASISEDAIEVVFTGYDHGEVENEDIHYQRSITTEVALSGDTVLVYEMNGKSLTIEHGAPLRVIVPGHYGMDSVKWLRSIDVVREPFEGHFVKNAYRMDGQRISTRAVRAVATGFSIDDGRLVLEGIVTSGAAKPSIVEISTDGGENWIRAVLPVGTLSRYGATNWKSEIELQPGHTYSLIVRGTDASDNTQPLEAKFNEGGYGNNAVQRLTVYVPHS